MKRLQAAPHPDNLKGKRGRDKAKSKSKLHFTGCSSSHPSVSHRLICEFVDLRVYGHTNVFIVSINFVNIERKRDESVVTYQFGTSTLGTHIRAGHALEARCVRVTNTQRCSSVLSACLHGVFLTCVGLH